MYVSCTEPLGPCPSTVLSLNLLPFLLDKTIQDKMLWFGRKIFFSIICWQQQAWGGFNRKQHRHKAEKTSEKLMVLIDREEQDTGKAALVSIIALYSIAEKTCKKLMILTERAR